MGEVPISSDEPRTLPVYMDSAAVVAGIFFLYLITAQIGLSIHNLDTFATLIWPPSGITLAAFLIYGSRIWPGILFAAFLVNILIGVSIPAALGIAVGNTLGPIMGATFLRWYTTRTSDHLSSQRVRGTIGILLCAFFIPVVTTALGIGSLWLEDPVGFTDIGHNLISWWTGDLLGILIFTPFLLYWFNRPLFERTRLQQLELVLVLIVTGIVSYFVFWTPQMNFLYYIFVPLTWATLRTGPRGTTLTILLVVGIAVAGTVFGRGLFSVTSLPYLQIFLITLSSIFLIFSSSVEDRRSVFETLKQHAEDLEKALETIRYENEAKKEFISILAHELRNPLATILSSIELIKLKGVAAPESNSLLTTVDERSRAMVRLLDDLLDISRISKKKLTLHKETISVDLFMNKLGSIVRPLMQRYGHSFSMTTPHEDLYLRADPVRLEQILMNLLANAARYTKVHGEIELLSGREEHMLAIHIRDSGIGIPKGMLKRIFEPFFQINRTQVGNEGIGIGLSLTRDLVEMHGGTIEAGNRKSGVGSEFIVRMPLLPSPEGVQTTPMHTPPLPVMRSNIRTPRPQVMKRVFKILVIDDNEAAADALSQLLAMCGHTTEIAFTGSQGIQKALEFDPDVVFLDIGLPDMSGYDVATKLREQKKSYFLIAITGYGQDDDKDRTKKAGIDQHLTKPAGLKEIQAALRKVPRLSKHTDL